MNGRMELRQCVRIARTEWTRHRRDEGRRRWGRVLVSLALAVALGSGAYSVGRDLASGRPLPATAWLLASGAFGWAVWWSSTLTNARFERLEPDLLLTAVRARTVTLGFLLFVAGRVVGVLVLPAVAVAIATATALSSPAVALTVAVAIGGLAVLAVGLGVSGRLAVILIGRRFARGSFYRDLLVVFGWVPVLVGWLVLQDAQVSPAVLEAAVDRLPAAWILDLALLGAGDRAGTAADPIRGLSAFGGLVAAASLSAGAASVLARRIWTTEPADATGSHGSRSLVHEGRLERVLGDRVPRPVLTVVRERWLMERRVPRGILTTSYAFLFVLFVWFPALLLAGGENALLLFFAGGLGLSVGVLFGVDPIGVEYRALPMLFTSVPGRQFVGGLVLAATVVGVPLVALVIVPIGAVSPVGIVETVGIAVVGMAVCTSTAAICLAVGMGVERDELVPVPFFFTAVPIFAEMGLGSFLRLGKTLSLASLVVLPAFVGNAPPVYERAAAVGLPVVVVQFGSLLVAISVAVVATRTAFRIAVERYQEYQIG